MAEIIVPAHVAIVMDGNGRWAKKRLLPRAAGHRAGMKRMIALSGHAFSCGVKCLTLFALSTENLSRPKEELDALYGLFREFFPAQAEELYANGIALTVIGERELLPADIAALIGEAEEKTATGDRGRLVLAIGYGARQEILSAANRAAKGGKELTEEEFSSLLYTKDLPPLDPLIRTGGEQRLSNFLLYQAAYAELYFSEKMFPEFTDRDFDEALKEFSRRDRRFGRV